jgi:nucleoside-diphosphate-sugar epimerase
MKVFLTGGSGYLGQSTIAAVSHRGHTVTALARNERAARLVAGAGATPVTGGLDDLDALRAAAGRAEAVIHLAQAGSAEADLAAAQAMLDGVGSGVYVHTGGTWVYGDTDGVADESAPWHPPAIVAWRRAVEEAVLSRADSGGRPVVIRPGLVYGGQNRLIDDFFTGPGRQRGAVPFVGDGTNHWALVHVEDIAELYAAALTARPGAVYNGVAGVDPRARDVALAISTAVGLDGKVTSLSLEQARERMGPVADAFALDQRFTPERARVELGWVPRHVDPLGWFRRTSA